MRSFAVIIALCVLSLLIVPAPVSAQGKLLATVQAKLLPVRSGPDDASPMIGLLKAGNKLVISAITKDAKWLFFSYWGKDAYISAAPADVALNVERSKIPVLQSVSQTNGPSIAVSDYSIDPAVPAPGQPFAIRLTLKNTSILDAGIFSVATTFPSGAFDWQTVGKLPAGESGQVALTDPGEQSTGRFTVRVALDVESQLGPADKSKVKEISVRVDRPYIAQGTVKISVFTTIDLHGGTSDLALDTSGLQALNGAQIALLNIQLPDVHFDMLANVKGSSVAFNALEPGAIIGIITSEGRSGVLRVESFDKQILNVQYLIYAK